MSRYTAFLRGMNLGGRRLRNDELRGHFLAMGFAEVETFRASGNVVFAASLGQAGGRSPDALAGYIEQGLAASLGYAVPTFIRDEAEVRAIAAAAPFEEERLGRCAGKLQVALFAVTPARDAQVDALALAGEQDGLVFAGRELYWLPSGGVLDSALDMKGIERLLGPMTMRTKGTIEQIAAKHFR